LTLVEEEFHDHIPWMVAIAWVPEIDLDIAAGVPV